MRLSFRIAFGLAVALVTLVAGCGPKLTPVGKKVIVAEGAPPAPNSGIIKTVFGTIIVDAQPGYKASQSLRQSARKRTGFEVGYLLMTSHHADHSLGNEVFSKAEIISTASARRAFLERAENERKMLSQDLRMSGLKSAQLMPSTMTFEKSMTLFAGWPEDKIVEVRLLEMPDGAAPGNMVVYLPAEKILFTGDLVTNGVFPYMGDADLAGWVSALDALDKLEVKSLVPGHGTTGGPELIWKTRRFLADLVAAVQAARKSGKTLEELRKDFSVPGYSKWPAAKQLAPIALESLWKADLPQIEVGPEPVAAPDAKATVKADQ